MHGQLEVLADRPYLRFMCISAQQQQQQNNNNNTIITITKKHQTFFSLIDSLKKLCYSLILTTLRVHPRSYINFVDVCRWSTGLPLLSQPTNIIFQGANIQPVQLSTCPVLLPFYLPPQIGTL